MTVAFVIRKRLMPPQDRLSATIRFAYLAHWMDVIIVIRLGLGLRPEWALVVVCVHDAKNAYPANGL